MAELADACKRSGEVELASALRESISFGRFLSESLDWEKWSVFCHNKHLEEAKNCSVPGSVAQKKAYFEAHYKRTASQKSVGSPESENDGYSEMKAEKVMENACTYEENHGLSEGDDQGAKPSNRVQSCERETSVSQIELAKVKLQRKERSKELPNQEKERRSQQNLLTSSSKAVTSVSKENKAPQSHLEIGRRSTDRRKVASESENPTSVHKILPMFEKMGDSKATCASARPSKLGDGRTKTPARASTNGVLKHTITTPQTDHKRAYTQSCETSCGRRRVDPKLCMLSINCFKSPSAREYKEINAGSASSSCKNKEQSVSEVRKMWQNRCFKARPLPDFYHNAERSKIEVNKAQLKKTASPVFGRSNSKSNAETRPLRSSFTSPSLRSGSWINAMT
ncbi:hypothetical protein HPP92_019823 [Vanilla planifolia]|uniref:TPX2 C-terminal domain-containing protein n=1 Tax=Vanilla planifolia TaxID=51239 RepID=A0A835Q9Q8_VANPL|nr:hypothetical protein HPP92_019823 [Vanilla planifolia]